MSSDRAVLRIGAVAVFYLAWVISWLVLGHDASGSVSHNWVQALVAVVAAGAALNAARSAPHPYRLFLVIAATGLVMLAASWATYQPGDAAPFSRFAVSDAPSLSDLAYTAFIFVWMCAWGYLATELWRRRPPSALTGVVFAVLVVGLAIILASFYYPQYRASFGTMSGRLDTAASVLDFAALVVGLACILLGEPAVLTWMVCATALLVASDLGYSEADVPSGVEPVWMLGQCLLTAALLVFPNRRGAPVIEDDSRQRSGVSGVLILLSLGGVLLSVAIGVAPVHPVWTTFLAVLFVVLIMVVQVRLTDRFDEAVQFMEIYTARLYGQKLRAEDWRHGASRLRATLHSTGLGAYLDALRGSADRMQNDVLFLGPERLYPAPRPFASRKKAQCFIVMPFGLDWSADVHRVLSTACNSALVHAVRGDDVFTPTDILVDIWHGINDADFVIADITGRNANVLYELGIAHTLAKPVLIVSRNAADIPIDLSTRRVILYGQSDADWRQDLNDKVTRAVGEILRTYGLPIAQDSGGGE